MNRSFLGLALALSLIPVAARADDTNALPQLTPAQRQAMHQTFERYGSQEEQLHQQMRTQILSSLTPVHRRAVAATIGDLAVSTNPDPLAAAKRIDVILSPGERQRVLAAHQAFFNQSRQLHDQMRAELQSEMPAGTNLPFMKHENENGIEHRIPLDAGSVLLRVLSGHHMMEMGEHDHFMMHMEGAPPPP
ncbi:MAG TPA: hypothetical protein VFE35_09185 [Candidatus Cybelea sp.]|jgi:hypothetical protein|nr:hypothetical protein [Candidatus Cybelea sp.]